MHSKITIHGVSASIEFFQDTGNIPRIFDYRELKL